MGLFSKLKRDKGAEAGGKAAKPGKDAPPPKLAPPPSAAKAPDPATRIAELQKHLNMLDKKEDVLLAKMKVEQEKALKAAGDGNRARAKEHMETKKLLEAQQARIAGQRKNINKQKMAIEEAVMNNAHVDITRMGAAELSKLQEGMSADVVDDIMADLGEQLNVGKDISDALGMAVNGGDYVDEMAAEDELDALLEAQAQEKLMADQKVTLPSGVAAGPSSAAAKPQKSREEELAALEASLM
ncbi:Vacuolar-sorting protein snf7 [Porphyridium purpureum]|uniref:Vacuolar-sorting protein snf7 n=1 Tax=Porphyridium purpureum TaxID=35688 RepID=A0A5J4YT11_PORPP|nr:Vacuolar-sorting protein snf7 [Porphyridium purpureum]|eukprot:POR0966..scf227_4